MDDRQAPVAQRCDVGAGEGFGGGHRCVSQSISCGGHPRGGVRVVLPAGQVVPAVDEHLAVPERVDEVEGGQRVPADAGGDDRILGNLVDVPACVEPGDALAGAQIGGIDAGPHRVRIGERDREVLRSGVGELAPDTEAGKEFGERVSHDGDAAAPPGHESGEQIAVAFEEDLIDAAADDQSLHVREVHGREVVDIDQADPRPGIGGRRRGRRYPSSRAGRRRPRWDRRRWGECAGAGGRFDCDTVASCCCFRVVTGPGLRGRVDCQARRVRPNKVNLR